MERRFNVYFPGRVLYLNEDPPAGGEGGESGDGGVATATAPKASEIEGLGEFVTNAVRGTIKAANLATSSDFGELKTMLEGLSSKHPTPAETDPPPIDPTKKPKSEADPESHKTDPTVESRRMAAEMAEHKVNFEKLKGELETERTDNDIRNRDNGIMAIAAKLNVEFPADLLAIVKPGLVKDKEKGWLFEVVSEEFGGKEFLTAEEHLPKFLEKRPGLLKKNPRGGSGAGEGSDSSGGEVTGAGTVGGRKVDSESLSDPAYYRENRDAVHKVLEARMKNHRARGGSYAPT